MRVRASVPSRVTGWGTSSGTASMSHTVGGGADRSRRALALARERRGNTHGGGAGPGPRARTLPGTLRIGSIRGVDVLVRSSWLLVAILFAVLLAPADRGGGARAGRLEVRRRPGLRGALLPAAAAPRGLARPDGAALRPRRAVDHPVLPRRRDRDRLRDPHARPGVQGLGRGPADLDGARLRVPGPAQRDARRAAAPHRARPRLGEPDRRRVQPAAGTAVRRRSRAPRGGLEADRQHAPRHDRRGLGRPSDGRAGAVLAVPAVGLPRPGPRHLRLRDRRRARLVPVVRGDAPR